jgi:superfamily II DNA or RNA helicase
MLNAPVSYGKTFTALAIAAKLGQKTLIVTHTTMLRDQWIEEIEKIFGIEAGIIGTGKFNIRPIIVVGNVQTITKRMADLSDAFGTVILDELHHISATTFSSVLDKSKARYKIGLSGTIIRKDMKHVLFNDYFGFHVLKPDKENCMTPQVVVVETDIRFPGGKHWANKITELENELPEYRRLIVDLATSAASKGYKVLVVASRVEFLVWAAEQVPRAASITGQVKDIKERTSILNKIGTGELDVIFGTMSIFSEGISQNDLSCLILATPTNNEPMLTQLIGRIIREVPGKKQPLILDISLKGSTVKGQSAVRLGHYLKSGYQVRVLKK